MLRKMLIMLLVIILALSMFTAALADQPSGQTGNPGTSGNPGGGNLGPDPHADRHAGGVLP